jgi:cell division septation protein DedD
MFITLKHRIFAVLILIALAIILIPMWLHDASQLKIKLWGLPNTPAVPAVSAISRLPEIKMLNSSDQEHNPDAWVLQLGTFATAAQAQQLAAYLRTKNLPAYVEHTTVYVGPELTQDGLQKLVKVLAQDFKIKGNVVTFTAIPK